tara:strand:- start:450 stop:725 length:276 start_codon:yes stop_codon:yes gene_type:complete
MRKLILGVGAAGLIGLSVVGYSFASSDKPMTNAGALSEVQVRELLTKQGYTVIRLKQEHGELEAYVNRNGENQELKLDPVTGAILKREKDD